MATPIGPPRSGVPEFLRRHAPEILLVALSLSFAEFLTGSTVVLAAFLDPVSLAFLLGLYGAGVLLVREATVRWGKGWPTVLALGAAYGIVEEGIGTKTFFGPNGVHFLGVYGHFLGVNWVWATELTLFHAIFSIALPIAVVGLAFPETVGRPFLPTPRALRTTLAIFVATVVAMFVLFNPSETPSVGLLAVALAVVALLVVVGRRLPARLAELGLPVRPTLGRDRSYFAWGALFILGFFAISWIVPAVEPFPVVPVLGLLAWAGGFGGFVISRGGDLARPRPRLYFAAGLLVVDLITGTVFAAFGDLGALVVVGAVLFLLWRIRRRLLPANVPNGPVGPTDEPTPAPGGPALPRTPGRPALGSPPNAVPGASE